MRDAGDGQRPVLLVNPRRVGVVLQRRPVLSALARVICQKRVHGRQQRRPVKTVLLLGIAAAKEAEIRFR